MRGNHQLHPGFGPLMTISCTAAAGGTGGGSGSPEGGRTLFSSSLVGDLLFADFLDSLLKDNDDLCAVDAALCRDPLDDLRPEDDVLCRDDASLLSDDEPPPPPLSDDLLLREDDPPLSDDLLLREDEPPLSDDEDALVLEEELDVPSLLEDPVVDNSSSGGTTGVVVCICKLVTVKGTSLSERKAMHSIKSDRMMFINKKVTCSADMEVTLPCCTSRSSGSLERNIM